MLFDLINSLLLIVILGVILVYTKPDKKHFEKEAKKRLFPHKNRLVKAVKYALIKKILNFAFEDFIFFTLATIKDGCGETYKYMGIAKIWIRIK